jgi:predicted acyltransferase (DUF342 family)
MSIEIAIGMFFLLTLALVTIPFFPAIVEWRRKKDIEPLRVVRESQVDVHHFAIGFHKYVESVFGDLLAACRESGKSKRGMLEDGTSYIIVGEEETEEWMIGIKRNVPFTPVILSCEDLHMPDKTTFLSEIYADGSVVGGKENVLRAILAGKDIHLGRESTILRWLHGSRSVNVHSGSVLFGRASADNHIHIEENCRFERLNAPCIDFCSMEKGEKFPQGKTQERSNRNSAVLKRLEVTNPVEAMAGRWLVFGDLEIPQEKIVENDLVVTGRLKVGSGVHVIGSLKSRNEMRLDKGVEVEGSVVSERNINIDSSCRISGPILSERAICIRTGTTVGSKIRPTTVSGERIFIEPGVCVHGTVWAHLEGRVSATRQGEIEDDRR